MLSINRRFAGIDAGQSLKPFSRFIKAASHRGSVRSTLLPILYETKKPGSQGLPGKVWEETS